jgi:hypothetical protein
MKVRIIEKVHHKGARSKEKETYNFGMIKEAGTGGKPIHPSFFVKQDQAEKRLEQIGFSGLSYLSRGVHGVVYSGYWDQAGGDERAIKVLSTKNPNAAKEVINYEVVKKAVDDEAGLKQEEKLISKHFPKIDDIIEENEHIFIIMEKLENDPNIRNIIQDIFPSREVMVPAAQSLKYAKTKDIQRRVNLLFYSTDAVSNIIDKLFNYPNTLLDSNQKEQIKKELMKISWPNQERYSHEKKYFDVKKELKDEIAKDKPVSGMGKSHWDVITSDLNSSGPAMAFIDLLLKKYFSKVPKVTPEMEEYIKQYKEDMKQATSDEEKKQIIDDKWENYYKIQKLKDGRRTDFIGIARDFIKMYRAYSPMPFHKKTSRQMYAGSPVLSQDNDEKKRIGEYYPGSSSLLDAIDKLEERYGLVAADMHDNNAMTRPGMGTTVKGGKYRPPDIVIMDVGNFMFEPKAKKSPAKPESPKKKALSSFNLGFELPDESSIRSMPSLQEQKRKIKVKII